MRKRWRWRQWNAMDDEVVSGRTDQIKRRFPRWCLVIRWRYPRWIYRNTGRMLDGWLDGWMDGWIVAGQWRWWQTRSHPDRNLSAPMIQGMQQPQTAIMRPIMTQLNVVRVVCIWTVWSWLSFDNGFRRWGKTSLQFSLLVLFNINNSKQLKTSQKSQKLQSNVVKMANYCIVAIVLKRNLYLTKGSKEHITIIMLEENTTKLFTNIR